MDTSCPATDAPDTCSGRDLLAAYCGRQEQNKFAAAMTKIIAKAVLECTTSEPTAT
jgi:hypothetical protein